MSEKTLGQKKLEELAYKKKNVYEEASSEKIKLIYKIFTTIQLRVIIEKALVI